MITLVQPFMEPTLPTEMSAERPRKSAHSSQPFSGAVEVLDRLVDRQLPVAVLDDHATWDDVHFRHPIEIDAALVAELPQGDAYS